jgi:hypothetical protein
MQKLMNFWPSISCVNSLCGKSPDRSGWMDFGAAPRFSHQTVSFCSMTDTICNSPTRFREWLSGLLIAALLSVLHSDLHDTRGYLFAGARLFELCTLRFHAYPLISPLLRRIRSRCCHSKALVESPDSKTHTDIFGSFYECGIFQVQGLRFAYHLKFRSHAFNK